MALFLNVNHLVCALNVIKRREGQTKYRREFSKWSKIHVKLFSHKLSIMIKCVVVIQFLFQLEKCKIEAFSHFWTPLYVLCGAHLNQQSYCIHNHLIPSVLKSPDFVIQYKISYIIIGQNLWSLSFTYWLLLPWIWAVNVRHCLSVV